MRLGDKREGVQLLVDDAKRNAQVVGPDVVSWLEKLDLAEKDSKELLRNRIGARRVCTESETEVIVLAGRIDSGLHLKIPWCSMNMKEVKKETPEAVFPQLESLEICNLNNLNEICHGQPPSSLLASFAKLRSLTLRECPKLKNIFSMSIARGLILQTLDVRKCKGLEVTISKIGKDDEKPINQIVLFPELTHLKLGDLPKLRGLNSISSRNKDTRPHEMDKFADRSQRYDQRDMGSPSVLFVITHSRTLSKLERLDIHHGDSLQVIFDSHGLNVVEESKVTPILGQLAELTIRYLSNAEGSTLSLPSLKRLFVAKCPKVKILDHMINTSMSLQLKSTDFTTKPSSAVPKTKTVSDGSGISMDSHHDFSRWFSCCGSTKITLPSGSDGPFITSSTDEMNIIKKKKMY
ncbi:hypothetical protein FEM48_Zijuj09G0069700 [Ziziphus jujuba var. spinosa]|uniref:Disease resistance protein At4g27190-like leucine-rich repeats domain-containing protein n=1 Tax=Ziziphus jujuba var. spinosa TaxID=714518 RepID=A0A978URI4_ZIZJJ|nr:hypothetical protein FEM48_Zijuj09G0069700 [Ziziphus jujuba var. spinosa]